MLVPEPPEDIRRDMPEGMTNGQLYILWGIGWVHGYEQSDYIPYLPSDEDLRIYTQGYNAGEDARAIHKEHGIPNQQKVTDEQAQMLARDICELTRQEEEMEELGPPGIGVQFKEPLPFEVWVLKNFWKISLTLQCLHVLGIWSIACHLRGRR